VKVSRAAETSGPIGVVIDVDRSRLAQGVVVVALSGDVDVFSVPRLRSTLIDLVGVVDVVLDMAGVAFCDSSALRVFVDAQRRASAGGRTLEITHPSTPVRNLFDVSGLRGVLRVTS
jgi:anti-sigma B factor antagonist